MESQNPKRMLKLILADNQAIFRAGAAKVLAVEDEIRVVAQTQNYEQTLMALEKFRASILIFATALHPASIHSSPIRVWSLCVRMYVDRSCYAIRSWANC